MAVKKKLKSSKKYSKLLFTLILFFLLILSIFVITKEKTKRNTEAASCQNGTSWCGDGSYLWTCGKAGKVTPTKCMFDCTNLRSAPNNLARCTCKPGSKTCLGNDLYECKSYYNGQPGTPSKTTECAYGCGYGKCFVCTPGRSWCDAYYKVSNTCNDRGEIIKTSCKNKTCLYSSGKCSQ